MKCWLILIFVRMTFGYPANRLKIKISGVFWLLLSFSCYCPAYFYFTYYYYYSFYFKKYSYTYEKEIKEIQTEKHYVEIYNSISTSIIRIEIISKFLETYSTICSNSKRCISNIFNVNL